MAANTKPGILRMRNRGMITPAIRPALLLKKSMKVFHWPFVEAAKASPASSAKSCANS